MHGFSGAVPNPGVSCTGCTGKWKWVGGGAVPLHATDAAAEGPTSFTACEGSAAGNWGWVSGGSCDGCMDVGETVDSGSEGGGLVGGGTEGGDWGTVMSHTPSSSKPPPPCMGSPCRPSCTASTCCRLRLSRCHLYPPSSAISSHVRLELIVSRNDHVLHRHWKRSKAVVRNHCRNGHNYGWARQG